MKLPLEGITVVEFSHTVMGPVCGMLLADMGADVIKIEPSPDGDPTRRLKGFATGFFAYYNRNKRSICLNLKTAEGLSVALDLIRNADVLLENYAPGAFDRMGLGYKQLSEINPGLIYCALKGFLPGPYGHRGATDEIIQHMIGLTYMTGLPDQPLRAGTSVIDISGGVMGAMGILGALRLRDQDGKGREVTSTLFESGAFLMGQHLAQEAATGTPVPPMTQRGSAWGIYEVFKDKEDMPIFIGLINDRHWANFCKSFGFEDLIRDSRFLTNADRVKNRFDLRDVVAGVVSTHTVAELSEVFNRDDIPYSPVNRPNALFEDPQLNHDGRMLNARLPNGKMSKLPALPFTYDGKTLPLRLQSPMPGENTNEILHKLGYGDDRIQSMREKQIIA